MLHKCMYGYLLRFEYEEHKNLCPLQQDMEQNQFKVVSFKNYSLD